MNDTTKGATMIHAARPNVAEMVLAAAFYGERPGDGQVSALCGAIIRAGDRAATPAEVTCPKCHAEVVALMEGGRTPR